MAFEVLVLVTIGSLLGLFGGVIFILNKKLASLLSDHAVPFAAGVLLTASFLDVLPEALSSGGTEKVLAIVLLAVLGSFLVESFLFELHHHGQASNIKSAVPLVIFGDTIHNFMDGVAIAASFLTDPKLGVLVAVATLLHEIPHEVGDFGILLAASWTPAKTLLVNFFSACASYLGAIFVLIFANLSGLNLNVVLAIAAGMFIYLGASDFLPMVKAQKASFGKVTWLISGVAIMWFVSSVVTI
jgi:zinc and cadmium transporter